MSHMRAPSNAASSPENRPLTTQPSRQGPPVLQSSQPAQEAFIQAAAQPMGIRTALRTPPVKEESHTFSHPLATHAQPPPPAQSHTSVYTHSSQAPTQPPAPAPAPAPTPKPAEPRKSNLLSLLNDEPEEPRRKKTIEAPSHTPTPQQQAPIAPPPSGSQSLPQRRDPYGDGGSTLPAYARAPYAHQSLQSQAPPSSRQVVDLTTEPSNRPTIRESWGGQRPNYLSGQGQTQHPPASTPHSSLLGNHRSLLAQHNNIRHNPSPPPIPNYNNSPHLHSRTPSLSGASAQQLRHSMGGGTPVQAAQPGPGTSQILQPNPYAQVDLPGSSSQPSAAAGMRPSPHLHTSHAAQSREMQGRNEQSQIHNANLPYSNPQTPNEMHPAQQHMRVGAMPEHYRSRDPREHNDFDTRNHERDVSRELSNRSDAFLRDRESFVSRTGSAAPTHQDLRYQHPAQPDRGYPGQRSHTPLARTEPPSHPSHPSIQHGPSYREHFPLRDDRGFSDRMRDEQAHQQARMRAPGEDFLSARERELRDREMRERDARYRDELYRRESRLPPTGPSGVPGHAPPGHEQRPPPGGAMDWVSGVPRQHDPRGWQR